MTRFAPRTRQTPLSLALFAAFAAGAAHADEGMWVPQQLPEIAGPLKQAGLRRDPAQLADLTGPTLGAVVSLGGCTASFVSPVPGHGVHRSSCFAMDGGDEKRSVACAVRTNEKGRE